MTSTRVALLSVIAAVLCAAEEQPLYNVGGKSCYACPPGYKMIEECTEDGTTSTCDVCPHNTYMLGWNLERNCKMKPSCPTNQRILHHDPRSSTYVCGCAVGEYINATTNRCESCPTITCPKCPEPKDCLPPICPPNNCGENNIKNEVTCDCPETTTAQPTAWIVAVTIESFVIVILVVAHLRKKKPKAHPHDGDITEHKTPPLKEKNNGYMTANEKKAIQAQDDGNVLSDDDLSKMQLLGAGEKGEEKQGEQNPEKKVFVGHEEPPPIKDMAHPLDIRTEAIKLVCDIIETENFSDEEFEEIAQIAYSGQYRVLYNVLNELDNPIRTLMNNVANAGRQDLSNLIKIKTAGIGYILEDEEQETTNDTESTAERSQTVVKQPLSATIDSAMEEISRIIVKKVTEDDHLILYHVYRLNARQISQIKSDNSNSINRRLVAGYLQFRETHPNMKVEDLVENLRKNNRRDIADEIVQTMEKIKFQLDLPPEEINEVDNKLEEACRSLQQNIGTTSPEKLFNQYFRVPVIPNIKDLSNEELAHKYLEKWKQMNGQDANTEKLLSALLESQNRTLYNIVKGDLHL